MGKFVNFLERKIGKYAIPRLPMYILICYAIGYLMSFINPQIAYVLSLNPYAILHGQVWRLVTWVLIPPPESNLFFVLIMLYFYYSLGMTLERTWGTFYFNYYIFSGMLFTILGAFCMYGYVTLVTPDDAEKMQIAYKQTYGQEFPVMYGGNYYYAILSTLFSTYYVNMSIFLAFAATYPDMHVMLMFILPIKVKVLGIIYAILLVFDAFSMGIMGVFVIGASLLNFLLFFFSIQKGKHRSFKQIKRQREFQKKTAAPTRMRVTKHKCAICGRTDESHPDLEFRFCSKCEGNYEYCQDHLFSHKHIKRDDM